MKNIDKIQPERFNWQHHIDNYCNSENSKAVYCAENNLNLKQFEYHYRRWYEALKEEQENENNPTPAQFSPVIVKPNEMATSISVPKQKSNRVNSGVELQLANGVRCKVEANFCRVTLKQVMELVL
jgi:hypothetical protein